MHDNPAQVEMIAAAQPVSAARHIPSHLRLWPVAAAGLWLDLWSKQWAVTHLAMHQSRPLIDRVLSLRLSLNPGALFGLGAGMAPIFVGASVLALLFVVYLFAQSTNRQRTLHLALGCVLGGAAGNLYDRTFVSAYVVDDGAGRRDVCELVGPGRDANEVIVGDFATLANGRRYDLRTVHAERQPVVRDFLSIELKAFDRPIWPWVFNIADALLVLGVGVLLLNFWFDRRQPHPAPPESAPPSDQPPVL